MKTLVRTLLLIAAVLVNSTSCTNKKNTIAITKTTVNYKENPTGVQSPVQFGWVLESDQYNQFQTAYHILVADNLNDLEANNGTVWDSDKSFTNQSINILKNIKLKAGERYFWKVKVWDKDSIASAWSSPSSFITALSTKASWEGAEWISYETMPDSLELVPGIPTWGHNTKGKATRRAIIPYFRKTFSTDKKVSSAFLFISGLGHYKAFINGKQISNDYMSPGWTDYHKTCLYNTYDVTKNLSSGENAIGVQVGTGFYNINNERYRKLIITYGMPKTIAKLQINYSDGTRKTILTNKDWKASPSPLIYSSIYGGESYDARMEQPGWNTANFNDSSWKEVYSTTEIAGTLKPEITYPVTIAKSFTPIKTIQKGVDTIAYDFGQNASAIVEITVKGKKGDTLRVYPSELLHETLRASQRFTGGPHYYEYILKGEEAETFTPMFTYYGMRYATVTGASPEQFNTGNAPVIEAIKMHHTTNSSPKTGSFWCSNPLFNQIDTLIRYAIKSNFQSVLTDCPHRERLGWIEQTYLMGNSVKFNYDLFHVYHKLVGDMMDSQRENGMIGSIAPEYIEFGGDFSDSPEWGSAIVQVPWLMYKWYGDKALLEKAWESMTRYMTYLDSKANNNILSYGLGDWYDLGPNAPGWSQLSPTETTATSIYYSDYKVLAEITQLLGKEQHAVDFKIKAEKIRIAYNELLFHSDVSIYATGSQSAMAIPLSMEMIDQQYKESVFANLVDSIVANNKQITAGDIGFHYLIDALTKGNQSQLIYEMNNRDDVPGYGYQLKQGATALTESWDALPNKSNNHFMLGHIMEWFYTGLGGIRQDENSVAYKNIILKPAFIDGLTAVKTSYKTPYGSIVSEWLQNESGKEMRISIPVNTSAQVYLPATENSAITVNDQAIETCNYTISRSIMNGFTIIEVGSGDYTFSIVD